MNWNSVHICLPIQVLKSPATTSDIDANAIAVNNFLAHWIKEIDIKRYGDELQILPTNNATDIYRYFAAILKHMPKEALKAYEKTLLYSKEKVNLPNNMDKRLNNTTTVNATNRTDANLTDKISKFMGLISQKNTCRNPLRFLTDIDLVMHPLKLGTKTICTNEQTV